MNQQPQPPSLPNYSKPGIAVPTHPKQQAPLLKLLGKMLTPKIPKMLKGKISPQTVKMKHKKKVTYW